MLGEQAQATQHELRVEHVGDGRQARLAGSAPGRARPIGRGVPAGDHDAGCRRGAGADGSSRRQVDRSPPPRRPTWLARRSRMRVTSSRTAPRWPMTMPLCSAAAVSTPMASSGRSSSTRGSRAVPSARACAARPRPGRMAPPRKKPSASTASTVVAVPRSTTMTGRPCRTMAAQAASSRSGPVRSGRGSAVSSGMRSAPATVRGSPSDAAARSRRAVQRSTTLTATMASGGTGAFSTSMRKPAVRSAVEATEVSRRPASRTVLPSTRAALAALLPMSTPMITRR